MIDSATRAHIATPRGRALTYWACYRPQWMAHRPTDTLEGLADRMLVTRTVCAPLSTFCAFGWTISRGAHTSARADIAHATVHAASRDGARAAHGCKLVKAARPSPCSREGSSYTMCAAAAVESRRIMIADVLPAHDVHEPRHATCQCV